MCLDNYIAIKGHCKTTDAPSSGLYINVNLPGITLEKAANTAEGALNTGVDLLNQSITNGISRTRQELVGAMLGRVRFNQIISGGEYGEFTDTFLPNTNDKDRGAKARLDTCCRLGKMYVPRVRILFATTAANRVLKITDAYGTTTNYTFDSTAYVPVYVETKYTAQTDTIYIKVNNTDISVNESTLGCSSCGFCSNSCSHCDSCSCSDGLIVTGWDSVEEGNITFGISPTIQVICDAEKFFCEISHLEMTEWAVLYAAGVDFLRYNQLTNRVNVYTLYNDDEEVNDMIADWEAKHAEKLRVLTETLPKYLNSIDSCCLECNAATWHYAHP